MKRVLINRTDAIGDTLLTSVLARAIKKQNQDIDVHFIVSDRSGELISFCDGVDRVHIYKLKGNLLANIIMLGKLFTEYKYDFYLHIGGSFVPTFFAFLFLVKRRSGILSKLWSYLFLNCGLRQSRSKVEMHEIDYNLQFLEVMGLISPLERKDVAPKLNLDQLHHQDFADGPYCIVHPGMTGHTLNWPMKSYAQLIDLICEENLLQVLVSYTPSDMTYIDELKEHLTSQQVSFYDGTQKGLVHYGKVLKGASLFIGPSTGTTHMANAVGTAQIGLYSPILTQSAKRWGPALMHENCVVFAPEEGQGMDTIYVDDVYNKVKDILGRVL